MELLIVLLGFVGSWLLFTGSVYQASLELREEGISHERLEEIKRTLEDPLPPVSQLWWFLPPVKLYLERRRSIQFRQGFMSMLSVEDREMLVNYFNKARGWLIVAGGGWVLAIKETFETGEIWHLSPGWTFLIILGMSVTGIFFTVLSSSHVVKRIGH